MRGGAQGFCERVFVEDASRLRFRPMGFIFVGRREIVKGPALPDCGQFGLFTRSLFVERKTVVLEDQLRGSLTF